MALMGGTSNYKIVKDGTPETIQADVAEKLQHGIDIIGPECAVPLDAPYENLVTLAADAKLLLRAKACCLLAMHLQRVSSLHLLRPLAVL